MEKILVVEDDRFYRHVFSDLLSEEGYEVDAAGSGGEALSLLSCNNYIVVICDLILPDMSGFDILSKVKDDDASIEVIIVTGHANTETAIFALKNGARDYLIKPINPEELKHAVALCFEQRRLLDENLELKKQINLFQISQAIANCQEQDRVHKLIVDALAKEAGVSKGLGFFSNEDLNLQLKEIKGFNEATADKLGELLSHQVNSKGGGEGSSCLLHKFCPPQDNALEHVSYLEQTLVLFIRSKHVLQGVIYLFNEPGTSPPGYFNFRNLQYLLEQSSLALENAARFAKAKNMLNIDELTGLFNYRYLDITLEREVKRAERYDANLSVLFVDLDFFKNVNDTYGHMVGSRLLGEVGALLKRCVREEDTVIRYGGDEYTLILVETGIPGAMSVAERIRCTIENHIFFITEGLNLKITASLGCASFPEDARTKTGLLELADKAMYRGKAMGKNRVYCISEELEKPKEKLLCP